MYFYDDNEIDNKKEMFDNKYGKLTSSLDIIEGLEKKENKNNIEKKNIDINKNQFQKKKRKRHDSSDEEEKKIEIENKKAKEKEENKDKEEFLDKVNNIDNLDLENEINSKKEENNKKESWKKGFVDVEELNRKKIEVKEMAKLLDDPMKNLLTKNKLIEETDELIKRRGFYLPKCKFAPFNNRFDIKPGYRWDGVNRSNGFENKIMNLNFNINS